MSKRSLESKRVAREARAARKANADRVRAADSRGEPCSECGRPLRGYRFETAEGKTIGMALCPDCDRDVLGV